ncbi:hypothetical protein SAMN06265375_102439 [Muriicola jejuensis]|uniref:hypothetical protein n=1 Tax=Muriicola jejuensis TaxID=504488 RepID=UPI001EF8AD74|nr:hypothetical protein [Muriicola jejuensis]SMP17765.1 hypothetical protein SAMN06265375_102439 [Muriicola jejuensis]
MKLTNSKFLLILAVVIIGFGIGIYLQDLKHKESTEAAWKANRYNLERFNQIREYTGKMNAANWRRMRDSISQELDSFMILRFRKEMDSLNKIEKAGD